ncbi:hypothetical protein GCM10022243_01430 [Saccharothrix violaceirubra]|uniref:Uncharacterized protein n=1 Tax=Saccharothrix violaceirubra TaxID=413306 RepID=A0A7W7WVX0_9PSEU|nr:hypothetical protein [Saccharothrix violaceirubra]MBB4965357.1 hypothetical protein [Saccharothrix violaceirubra]
MKIRGAREDGLAAAARWGAALRGKRLPHPSGTTFEGTFTSLLPYRVGSRNRYVAAFPDDPRRRVPVDATGLRDAVLARPFTVSIMIATLTSAWQRVATLRVERPTEEDPDFDVVSHVLPGFALTGAVNRLRGPVYRGSQEGRRGHRRG